MAAYPSRNKILIVISEVSPATQGYTTIFQLCIPVKGSIHYFQAIGIKVKSYTLEALWTTENKYIEWEIPKDRYHYIIEFCPPDRMPQLMAAFDKGSIVVSVIPYTTESTL